MTDEQPLAADLDVLVVTGLQMEYQAARKVATSKGPGTPGALSWEERDQQSPTPYIRGEYITASGASMHVALARPTRMGGTSTAFLAATLVERLHPRCLAMCGACAGNPADVSLGDVIIAEMAYIYDEGKRLADGFEADHRQIPPHDDSWLRKFQELQPDGLPSHGKASDRNATMWLLKHLYVGAVLPDAGAVKHLLDNPLSVIPSLEWRMKLKPYLE